MISSLSQQQKDRLLEWLNGFIPDTHIDGLLDLAYSELSRDLYDELAEWYSNDTVEELATKLGKHDGVTLQGDGPIFLHGTHDDLRAALRALEKKGCFQCTYARSDPRFTVASVWFYKE